MCCRGMAKLLSTRTGRAASASFGLQCQTEARLPLSVELSVEVFEYYISVARSKLRVGGRKHIRMNKLINGNGTQSTVY